MSSAGTAPDKGTKTHIVPGQLNIVQLTPQQRKQWEMTRAALLWGCPAFTHVLYTMMPVGDDVALFTDSLPTMATDGKNMIINPEFFFGLSLQERIFGCAHEIAHAIFNHCGGMHKARRSGSLVTSAGKKIPYSDEMANVAMDLVINDMLIQSEVGRFKQGWLHDQNYGKAEDSWVDVYEKIYKDNKNNKGPQGQGFDFHLSPGSGSGEDADSADANRNEIEWGAAVASGMAAAKAQGKLPAGMERLLGKMVEPEPKWQEKIQAFFARKVGSGSYDWRKPDRNWIVRDIYVPGRSGYGAGHIVVGVDTSGSIGNDELDTFFGEMRMILEEVRPKKISVVFCDAKVHKVQEVSEPEDISSLKPKGGGGTAFEPVFDWIAKEAEDVDCLVYLTDGYGSFPKSQPKYPVLWGDIMCGKGVKYPWGDVVEIPIKHGR